MCVQSWKKEVSLCSGTLEVHLPLRYLQLSQTGSQEVSPIAGSRMSWTTEAKVTCAYCGHSQLVPTVSRMSRSGENAF